MSTTVTVRHTWEAGHRLPHLEGKCQSLHGHSWQVEVEVAGEVNAGTGVLVEFAAVKRSLREWIDAHLDHGLMLGADDPLVPLLRPHGRIFLFGFPGYAQGLPWPTVEAVAAVIARVADRIVEAADPFAYVQRVSVQETAVNRATWTRTPGPVER